MRRLGVSRQNGLADPENEELHGRRRTTTKRNTQAARAHWRGASQIRKEHPAIERKLSELVNRHDLRNARYRGLSKVLRQALLTGMAVNLKRIVKLCTPAAPDSDETETVRAELMASE